MGKKIFKNFSGQIVVAGSMGNEDHQNMMVI